MQILHFVQDDNWGLLVYRQGSEAEAVRETRGQG